MQKHRSIYEYSKFLVHTDTPSITAKLINEQKEDKEKKNHEEKEKMKADNGFQDNYSVVVASGTWKTLTLPSFFPSTLLNSQTCPQQSH